MLRAQLVQAGVAADLEFVAEVDAAVLQPLQPPPDDVFLQLEAGYAVGEQAAAPVVPVVNGDAVAAPPQQLRRRQPGRAGADNADRAVRAVADRADRLDPGPLPTPFR